MQQPTVKTSQKLFRGRKNQRRCGSSVSAARLTLCLGCLFRTAVIDERNEDLFKFSLYY